MACSGIALAVGLLLLYVPPLRHPGLLLVAGVATFTAGMMWPELAILCAQAPCWAALLAVMAQAFRQLLRRAYAVAPAVQGRTQFSDSKIKLADKGLPRTEGSSKITATTSPMSVQIPAAETKP